MASGTSSSLRLELMEVGANENDWGTITNENLQMLEGAATSYIEVTATSDTTLSVTAFTIGDYHNLVYKFTGTLTADITYTVPAYERPYIFHNASNYNVTVKVSGQTGVIIAGGTKAYVYCDGTDIRELVNNPASITATQTLTNKTLTAPRFSDGGFIADANGNELIVMDTVTSAVNEVTVSNAASPAVSTTMTIAAPAVVTVAATPPSGTPVVFTSTGTLPTGVVSGTTYFVKYINATTFNIAATTNGTSITTTGTQTGTHTATFTGVPIIAASGDGTNISVNIKPKGSGIVQANGDEVVTITGTQTLTNKTLTSPTITSATIDTVNIAGTTTAAALKVPNIIENGTYGSVTWASTMNYDVLTQSVWYVTTDTGNNWTLNIRGSDTATLASLMSNGDMITITMIVENGSTAFYNTAVKIDGTTVTPKWQGGTAPSAGSVSAADSYTYTIIKTASTPTYIVLASKTKFD